MPDEPRTTLGQFAHFALDLTHRQASILADRLDHAGKYLQLTPAQFAELQRLVHPEQFALARGPRPTKAAPGSRAKVSEMLRRRRRCQPLFADGDRRHDGVPRRSYVLVVQLGGAGYDDAWEEALEWCGVPPTTGGRGAKGRALPNGCSVEAE